MDSSAFTPGQRVWCRDGRRAEFIAKTPRGIVVFLGYRSGGSEDEDEYYDGSAIVSEVFAAPPVEAIEARITELLTKERAAKEALAATQASIRAAERDTKERLAKLAKYPPLEMLEALLDGKVTHFAVRPTHGNLAEIETFEEATTWIDTEFRRNRKELRMLALVGTGDKMQWMLNTYGDGSGHWKSVAYPCLSYDDAARKVAEYCQEAAAELPKTGVDYRHFHVMENAKKYGVKIPAWIPEATARARAEAAQAAIDKAALALATAKAAADKAA